MWRRWERAAVLTRKSQTGHPWGGGHLEHPTGAPAYFDWLTQLGWWRVFDWLQINMDPYGWWLVARTDVRVCVCANINTLPSPLWSRDQLKPTSFIIVNISNLRHGRQKAVRWTVARCFLPCVSQPRVWWERTSTPESTAAEHTDAHRRCSYALSSFSYAAVSLPLFCWTFPIFLPLWGH